MLQSKLHDKGGVEKSLSRVFDFVGKMKNISRFITKKMLQWRCKVLQPGHVSLIDLNNSAVFTQNQTTTNFSKNVFLHFST